MEKEIYIIKRDGRREKLDINKIRKYTASAVEGLNNVTQSELEVSCQLLFKDGMTSEEIQRSLIQTAVSKIDIDSTEWTFVAARLFLYDLYHRVTGTSGYDHLVKHFERCEKENRVTVGLKDLYDLEKLNQAIDPTRDLQFNYLGIKTIHDRYLIKDSEGKVIELPQYMFMGIAMFLAQDEEDRNEKAIEFYNVISKFEVMLATPTLSNARTPRHQLSSCYVGSMPDNIEGIFDAYKEMALLSKFGGGIGWDVSKIRGIGSFIDGHKNAAGGVIPFLKITNDLAIAVDQLGCVAENSFVILEDGTEEGKRVSIRDVKEGDSILSFNIKEGKKEFKKVKETHTLEVQQKDQIKITFASGNYIITSKWHPMCVKKDNGYTYVKSEELKVGDVGVCVSGDMKIVNIDLNPSISIKYRDLTVEDNENYFCSTDNVNGDYFVTHNTRKGAIATYLEVWHKDMPEFVELRKNSGEERRRTHDLFPAIWICDLFMKRVEDNADWSLFDPYLVPELTELYGEEFEKKYVEYENDTSVPRETLPAKELWKKILLNYFETGLPFLAFKDTANKANPNKHTGLIRSSNLCFTGDTLVAVESPILNYDKKTMTIKQLAELSQGKQSYTVYSAREEKSLFGSWKKEVKNAIAFKTGTKEVIKVVLNNGMTFRCTPDHKLALMDGTYREAIDCKGCLLEPFNSDYSQSTEILYEVKEIIRTGEVEDVYDLTVEDNHNFYIMYNDDIGVLVHNCTEIFQNTAPDHYQIEIEFEDGTKDYYEEEESVQIVLKHTGEVTTLPAKKITSIHTVINKEGILKKVYHTKRYKTDGLTAVCNLASVNLSKVNKKEDIERVIPTAIRMLDNVITLNFYPDRKPRSTNEITRAIGLGVMGEAEFLATNEIMFGTEEHFNKINEVMEAISYNAILASSNLALERGKYSTFEGSLWAQGIMPHDHTPEGTRDLVDYHETLDWDSLREKVKKDGMRNGYLMAVAPTSSISILVGTTQTIEPVYKRKWFEENLSGMIPVVVPNLKLETWNYYVSAYDVDQKDIIKAGAIRQKWIDQGQSLNLFIRVDENASIRRLHEIYTLAWKLGIKSTYYLRSESPEAKEDIVDRSMECQNCQ